MRVGRRPATAVAVAIALAGTFAVPAGAQDTTAFHELATELAGAYALEADHHLCLLYTSDAADE